MNKMKILVVDDEKDYRETFKILLKNRNYIVETAENAEDALHKMKSEYFPLVLSDVNMPGKNGLELLIQSKQILKNHFELILVTGYGDIQTAISATKNGAFGFFIKSHNPEELLIEIEKARRSIEMKNKIDMYEQLHLSDKYIDTSKNASMIAVLDLAKTIADTSSNVLITGESGVGKEIIAKIIHENSQRSKMPFVAINCQAFSENIIESELFGHEKGAFTGALDRRIGRFEEAHGGTIFLDEIGELSHSTQVKLLRVIENHTIERIGSNKGICVDFRLICATNKNIRQNIGNFFREDLFYRINTIEIDVPPLRDRKEDLDDLIFYFVNKFQFNTKKTITSIEPNAMDFLKNYDYPGNLRELKNIIERLVVTSKDGILQIDSMNVLIPEGYSSKNLLSSNKDFNLFESNIPSYKEAKISFEKKYFEEILIKFEGNITRAAKHIGISRRQLFNKVTEYNLKL